MEYYNVDDKSAAAIAQDLASAKNSHETYLFLHISSQLTLSGAHVIAHGLVHLQIRTLYIWFPKQSENVLPPILEVAIQHCQKLKLHLNDDGVAKKLSEVLLSLDDTNGADNYHTLQTLDLCIGSDLTGAAFQQLGNGLRHAKLKCLELDADAHLFSHNMIPAIYREAVRSVEELVLPFSLTGEDAVAFGNALMGNTTLQSVEFGLRRDLSIDDAVRLANGITQSHIVRLEMKNHGFYHNDSALCEDVEDALYEGVARSLTIQHLVVGYGLCGTSGLARCLTRLHTLQTHHSVVVDVPALMTGLISAPHLMSLNLGQYLEKEQDMLAVCVALPQFVSLTDLAICCQLAFDEQPRQTDGDDVVPRFDLRLQHVRPTGAEQLMVAVANHPSLLHVTLCGYRYFDSFDIGFAGLEMIGTHLPNIKLKKLNLRDVHDAYELTSKDVSVQRAFQMACQALVTGVRSNWHLCVLELPYRINFPSSVVDEIDFYLDLNKAGRYLLHNTVGEVILMGLWCHVLAKCGNKGLVFYYLRELPTLAYGG